MPAAARKAPGAKLGARLTWVLLPEGWVLVRAKSRSVVELAGMPKSDETVNIADMNSWRD